MDKKHVFVVRDTENDWHMLVEATTHSQARHFYTSEIEADFISPHLSIRYAVSCICRQCGMTYVGYPKSSKCDRCWYNYLNTGG